MYFIVCLMFTFGIYSISHAMEHKSAATVIRIRGFPKPHPLTEAALQGNAVELDKLLANMKRGENPQHEIEALTIAIYKGHFAIVQKLLNFFGNKIESSDADSAFGAASVCEKEEIAIAMIEKLCERKIFVVALSIKGYNQAIQNAKDKGYLNVVAKFVN
jgi:hypothetical protein